MWCTGSCGVLSTFVYKILYVYKFRRVMLICASHVQNLLYGDILEYIRIYGDIRKYTEIYNIIRITNHAQDSKMACLNNGVFQTKIA